MRFTIIILLLICSFTILRAQTIDELKGQLKAAASTADKIQLNYKLGEAYRASNQRDNEKDALRYAKASHDLAKSVNLGMAARSAFLVASIYKDERNERNQEVWFRTAESYAKRAKDSDLIIKSVVERGKLATKERNYRRASQIYEEAFAYFSKKGTSISELESQFEEEKAQLEGQKRQLEQERNRLQTDINRLSTEKDQLAANQNVLIREKQRVEAEISNKTEQLETVDEARKLAEQFAAQKALEAKNLSREKLEEEYKRELAEKEKAKAEALAAKSEMAKAKAQRIAERSRELVYLSLLLAGFLVVIVLLTYARFSAKRRANKILEEKNKIIEDERQRSDGLLLNILPKPIAEELKENGKAKAQRFEEVSVLFSDFKNFTNIAEKLTPEELVEELDKCFQAFDKIIEEYPEVEKIKTIGDAYMCASGLSERKVLPDNLVKAALKMQAFLENEKRIRIQLGKPYFEARIGIHTGPVVAGVVGSKKFSYDIWGDTVNTASRIESNSEVGKVNISETTFRLVKYNFKTIYRGMIQAKNKGEIDMYFVENKPETSY